MLPFCKYVHSKHNCFFFNVIAMVTEVLNPQIPQVLLNRELLTHVPGFDVRLLGYSDVIIATLCHKLGWDDVLGQKDPSPQGENVGSLLSTMDMALCLCVCRK